MTVLSVLRSFHNNFKVIAVIIISVLAAIIFLQKGTIERKDAEIARQANNVAYYQDQCSTEKQNNKILQLTIDELNYSKDSILQEINKVKEELKIKDKSLKRALTVQTHMTDTIRDTVTLACNFTKELKPNLQTTITVIREDSCLTVIPDIKNDQYLFVINERKYRRKYKNFISRLLHFDFKKTTEYTYQIVNSNDLINITDSKVVEISH